jgi:hypothetical protein
VLTITGHFTVAPALRLPDRVFLTKLAYTRRMKRDVGPEYGVEGEFYVDGPGERGQDDTADIIDDNEPPEPQPSLWCCWVPTEDGTRIQWNGQEKFRLFDDWLEYLIARILSPRGYILSGAIEWSAPEYDDFGYLQVIANQIVTERPKVGDEVTDHP